MRVYRDLVKHTFRDETSQFDPKAEFAGWGYDREYTCYVPARLLRRRPDLFDDFFCKYHEEDWFWGATETPPPEQTCFEFYHLRLPLL